MRRSSGRLNGFTIIELGTTLAMTGVLLMVALPGTVKMLEGSKVVAAKRQFTSAYSLAKAAARRSRVTAELHIDGGTGRFWVEVDPGPAGGATDTVGGVRNITGRSGQPKASDPSMTSNRSLVCFDPRGVATMRGSCEAGDLLVTFTVRGRADTLRTTAMGQMLRKETAAALP